MHEHHLQRQIWRFCPKQYARYRPGDAWRDSAWRDNANTDPTSCGHCAVVSFLRKPCRLHNMPLVCCFCVVRPPYFRDKHSNTTLTAFSVAVNGHSRGHRGLNRTRYVATHAISLPNALRNPFGTGRYFDKPQGKIDCMHLILCAVQYLLFCGS